MEPTFYEKEYLKVIDFLKREISDCAKKDADEDYAMGILEGRVTLATELIMQMQQIMIANFYSHE